MAKQMKGGYLQTSHETPKESLMTTRRKLIVGAALAASGLASTKLVSLTMQGFIIGEFA